MKKITLGFFIGLSIFVALNAFGTQPYNDDALIIKLDALKKEQTKIVNAVAEQTKIVNAVAEQQKAIIYFTNVLGEHQEVIINNTKLINDLDKKTIKSIEVKK